MGNRATVIRDVICIVFSFILFLSITCGMLSGGAAATVLSEKHLKTSIEDSIYAEKNFSALQSALEDEADEHGLPDELLSKLPDYKTFSSDLADGISAGLDGEESSDAADEFSSLVEDALDEYLEKNEVGQNSRIEAAVSGIVKEAAGYYRDYTRLPFTEYFVQYAEPLKNFVKIALPVCIAAAAVLLILILCLQPGILKRKIYICSSLLASGIATAAAGYLFSSGLNFTFSKSLKGYDSFIESFFGSAAFVYWFCGIAAFILAILIAAVFKDRSR